MILTKDELTKVHKSLEATTQGKWIAVHGASDCTVHDGECSGGLGLDVEGPPQPRKGQFARSADAKFIASAHNDYVPQLLAEVERLQSESNDLRERLQHLALQTDFAKSKESAND